MFARFEVSEYLDTRYENAGPSHLGCRRVKVPG
jgi:hypothetical protein